MKLNVCLGSHCELVAELAGLPSLDSGSVPLWLLSLSVQGSSRCWDKVGDIV